MSQAKTDFKVLVLIMIIFEQWSEKKNNIHKHTKIGKIF